MSSETKKEVTPAPGQRVIKAPFIEDIPAYIKEHGGSEAAMQELQGTYRQLKELETSLTQREASIKEQLPKQQETLDAVRHLIAGKDKEGEQVVRYELSEGGLYGQAAIDRKVVGEHVHLWLGANVMMEYSAEEAQELLVGNIASAEKALEQVEKDLDVIRERITTMEVNIARLYNVEVTQRKQRAAAAAEQAAKQAQLQAQIEQAQRQAQSQTKPQEKKK